MEGFVVRILFFVFYKFQAANVELQQQLQKAMKGERMGGYSPGN